MGTPLFQWTSRTAILDTTVALDSVAVMAALAQVGVIVDAHGVVTEIPRPLGRYIVHPTIAPAPNGGFHAVWGEADSLSRVPSNVIRMWYAAFDGAAWTAPELIPGAPRAPWNGDFSVSGESIGFATRDNPTRPLIVAWRNRGLWHTDSIMHGVFLDEGTVLLSREGLPVVLYQLDDGPTRGLYAVRPQGWDSAGAHWTPPVAFDTGATRQYSKVNGVRLGGDSLLVVWTRAVEGTLASAISPDGGVTWRRLADLPMRPVYRLKLILDDRGVPHLFYRSSGGQTALGAPGGIDQTMLVGERWTTPVIVVADQSFVDPIVANGPGGLLVIWGTLVPFPEFQPRSFGMVGTLHC